MRGEGSFECGPKVEPMFPPDQPLLQASECGIELRASDLPFSRVRYQVLDLCAGEARGLRTFASNETH